MFTGIIEAIGKVTQIADHQSVKTLSIQSSLTKKLKIGESIAINGTCLTAIPINKRMFKVELSKETIKRTTFDNIKINDGVNLERSLTLSSRLSGHLVSGHVDGIGKIKAIHSFKNTKEIIIKIPNNLSTYMIHKGSITIDGVSLTINKLKNNKIWLMIIPHTLQNTTLQNKKVADRVNIEVDLIAKYVEKLKK